MVILKENDALMENLNNILAAYLSSPQQPAKL